MNTEKSRARFVLCIGNRGSEDLEPRKVYQILPDRAAVREGYVRVIDESGEDYLYPAEYFVPVALPLAITRVLPHLAAWLGCRKCTGGAAPEAPFQHRNYRRAVD